MVFALYDARIYVANSLIYHSYFHTNQLPFPWFDLKNDEICRKLSRHVDRTIVIGEKMANVGECLITVFGCDFKDPLPINQKYMQPYFIKLNP
jgi:hypothetical protein